MRLHGRIGRRPKPYAYGNHNTDSKPDTDAHSFSHANTYTNRNADANPYCNS